MKKSTILLLFLFFSSLGLHAQSKQVAELKKEEIHSLHLYFYPSSLRMINIEKDENLYELVKEIKNIRYLNFELSIELESRIQSLKEALLEEGYEELMVMRHQAMDINILGHRDSDDLLVAMLKTEGAWHLLDIHGKFNPFLLSKQMEKGLNLGPLDSYLELQNKRVENRKKYEQIRKQVEDEEKLKTEKQIGDSITN